MITGMNKQFASKDDHLSRVSKDGTQKLIAAAVPLSFLPGASTKEASRSIPGPSPTLRLESITLSFGGVTALADFDLSPREKFARSSARTAPAKARCSM